MARTEFVRAILTGRAFEHLKDRASSIFDNLRDCEYRVACGDFMLCEYFPRSENALQLVAALYGARCGACGRIAYDTHDRNLLSVTVGFELPNRPLCLKCQKSLDRFLRHALNTATPLKDLVAVNVNLPEAEHTRNLGNQWLAWIVARRPKWFLEAAQQKLCTESLFFPLAAHLSPARKMRQAIRSLERESVKISAKLASAIASEPRIQQFGKAPTRYPEQDAKIMHRFARHAFGRMLDSIEGTEEWPPRLYDDQMRPSGMPRDVWNNSIKRLSFPGPSQVYIIRGEYPWFVVKQEELLTELQAWQNEYDRWFGFVRRCKAGRLIDFQEPSELPTNKKEWKWWRKDNSNVFGGRA